MIAMISHGVRDAASHWRLLLALYLVQATATALFWFAAQRTLKSQYALTPLFDRGVNGHVASLVESFAHHGDAWLAIFYTGIVLAIAYGVLSIYLTGGLLGALCGQRFADAASDRFGAFVRLWLWALAPWALGAVILFVGLAGGGPSYKTTFSLPTYLARVLLAALPGLLWIAVTACAVDYARVILVRDPARAAGRALADGFRLLFTHANPLPHYAVYLGTWVLVSLVYILATRGHAFAGTAGALTLFALRQLVTGARFLARVVTWAGQVRLLSGVLGTP